MVVDTVTSVSLDAPIAGDDILSAVEYDAGLTLSGSAQPGATVVVALDGGRKDRDRPPPRAAGRPPGRASEIAEGTYDAEISVDRDRSGRQYRQHQRAWFMWIPR